MRNLLSYYSIFLLGCILHIGVFAYIPEADLSHDLDRAVDRIEDIIERRGVYMRSQILGLLQEYKIKISDNERSLYIIDYLIQEIENEPLSLGLKDFPYEYENIEIVLIPEQIVATVSNIGSLGQRNDDAFEYLAGFIFGDNTQQNKIAMTSPVTRSKITETSYETAFIMPKKRTLETLPKPNNERVSIKVIPSSLKAVRRFSGYVTQDGVDQEWEQFQQELKNENIIWYGLPTLAQYDGPWVPENRRTNELRVSLNP